MGDLMVQIDSRMVLLKDCSWSMWAKCGCMVAVSMAVVGDRIHATEEQAHKNHTPRKRDRDREIRNGYRWELITMARYRNEIAAQWECEQHRKPTA
ncbi:hypothetical protein ABZ154_15215 [Streptomyces sp. NPDC006261]|uniref:hypothetical protein n=1 Tax=Streptomyces sp. NPDC006261 TaxID=3156739 RepID=UPI0033A9859F